MDPTNFKVLQTSFSKLVNEMKLQSNHLRDQVLSVQKQYQTVLMAVKTNPTNKHLEEIQLKWAPIQTDLEHLVKQHNALERLNQEQLHYLTVVHQKEKEAEISKAVAEAEIRGQEEVIKRFQEVKDMRKQCEKNEITLVNEIDHLIERNKEAEEKIKILKLKTGTHHDSKLRFRVDILDKELKKRESYIQLLHERIRKAKEAAMNLDKFYGRNVELYREVMRQWRKDDDQLLVESEKIKSEFVSEKGQSMLETLEWAYKAIDSLPRTCVHRADFSRIDQILKAKIADITNGVRRGNEHVLRGIIQMVNKEVSDLKANCAHHNEFRSFANTLQKTIKGDYTGIATDMTFTPGECADSTVLTTPPKKVMQFVTLKYT